MGTWGHFPICSYDVLNLASAFLCVALLAILLKVRGQNLAPSIDLTVLMILGYTALARLMHVVLSANWEFFTKFSWDQLAYGLWGGQIGFGLLAGAYLLITRAPFAPLADALAVTWALISVPHKLGCFLGGCCGGSPASVPWAMTFAGGQSAVTGVPVHPTQLYDAGAALVLGAALLVAFVRRRGEGRLLVWWGLGYAISKFATEWFRGDNRFIVTGPVSAAMIVEVIAIAGFAFLLLKPGLWNRMSAWREQRAAGLVEPPPGVGRVASFNLALGGFLLAAGVSATSSLVFDWPGTPVVVLAGIYIAWNLFRRRLVTRLGGPVSTPRRIVRAIVSVVTPITFFGLFRPLFDRHGRTLGDAAAGTYR